ncbi:GGDEF domain-containing protein [Roseixanthobacter liquoris]|uniref:GGDEF domain-containing protein n=1 Tax=Roseixanthobacter liquoris TaxID=3119921 RepID=UPI00372AA138
MWRTVDGVKLWGESPLFKLVDAALLVLGDVSMMIEAANPAAARLLGPELGTLPCAAAILGTTVPLALSAVIQGAKRRADTHAVLRLPCRTAYGSRTLTFSLAALPEAPGRWLATVTPAVVGQGDWPGSFAEILHALPVGVELYDRDLNALFYNKASDDLFLYQEHAVVHFEDWWSLGFPDPQVRARVVEEWHQRMAAAEREPESIQQTEWVVRCRDGIDRAVQFRFRWVGQTYVLVVSDVTAQRQLEQDLRRLAGSDPLTGLLNRRRFLEQAEEVFSARSEAGAFSMLMLDIDRFKSINDAHGHAAGDAVISIVAALCREALRDEDSIARMGGEEFAVLMPQAGPQMAMALAERLIAEVSRAPVEVDGRGIAVQLSIGGTSRGPEDRSVFDVLARADRALYAAKHGGRNRAIFMS